MLPCKEEEEGRERGERGGERRGEVREEEEKKGRPCFHCHDDDL